MWNDPFGLRGASEIAGQIDLLSMFLFGLCALFTLGVLVAVFLFSIHYQARPGDHADPSQPSGSLVAIWTGVPLGIVLTVFFWGARIEAQHGSSPPESTEIVGSARQWMWTFRHENGRTEHNALHIPVDVPIRLMLESEDALHRLSIPAFRLQQDALPGESTELWFRPTREGLYRFFCTEYCGSGHSTMSGIVYVLDPITYGHWLTGDSSNLTPIEAGEMLFAAFRCDTCHIPAGGGTGPSLVGRFGTDSTAVDGSATLFDANHVRESLLEPKAKIAAGYEPVMPAYKGQLDENQIGQLSAYLESLTGE